MLDAALDCVVTMDHEGRVVDFNPAAERTFGYRAERRDRSRHGGPDRPAELRERHRRGLARYLATEQAVLLDRRIEITGMRADGAHFPVELTITRIDVPGPPDVHRLPARHHRPQGRRGRAAGVARADRRGGRRRPAPARARPPRRRAAAARGAGARPADGARRLDDEPAAGARAARRGARDLDEATGELRELARGIHPAVLTEGGLRPALRGARRPLDASRPGSSPSRTQRFAAPVEATAYFTVAEALTNVARYAAARRVEVEVARGDGRLRVEVRDDGRGGADPAPGSGLRGLADRVAALDGVLERDRPPGGGTVLRAEIPCGS